MEDTLIGLTIVSYEELTKRELDERDWGYSPLVIVLSNGTRFYASRDSEGNGPGALFVESFDGNEYEL